MHGRKRTMKDNKIEVQQHTLLYENTLNIMISQLVKIIPGNTSSLFPISRKGYPVKPSLFKTNKEKSCWSNTTKLSYLLHMILYQPKDYTGFNNGWIYEAAVKHDSLQLLTEEVPQDALFRKLGNPWGKGSLFSHLVSCIVSLSMVTGLWAERVCWAKRPFT